MQAGRSTGRIIRLAQDADREFNVQGINAGRLNGSQQKAAGLQARMEKLGKFRRSSMKRAP